MIMEHEEIPIRVHGLQNRKKKLEGKLIRADTIAQLETMEEHHLTTKQNLQQQIEDKFAEIKEFLPFSNLIE